MNNPCFNRVQRVCREQTVDRASAPKSHVRVASREIVPKQDHTHTLHPHRQGSVYPPRKAPLLIVVVVTARSSRSSHTLEQPTIYVLMYNNEFISSTGDFIAGSTSTTSSNGEA